jgi:hypothetical protein
VRHRGSVTLTDGLSVGHILRAACVVADVGHCPVCTASALNPVQKDRHGRRYGAERVEYLQPFWAVPVVAIAVCAFSAS